MTDAFDLSKPSSAPATPDVFDLSKSNPTHVFKVGLGWDGDEVDFELTAFGCAYDSTGDNPTVVSRDFVVFYKQPSSPDGAILRLSNEDANPDTIALDNDDEVIVIDTRKLDPRVQEVSIVLTIYDGVNRGQTFGSVPSGCRVYDGETGNNLLQLNLPADYAAFTAVQIGSVYKDNGVWFFKEIGQGFANAGLADFIGVYMPGVQVRSEH